MADVSVKMGVSGIREFKQGMSDAEASVKTFDAALKANEKQVKASGNAEKDFQAETSLLSGKLEALNRVVSNAEQALKQMEANGVKTTSRAYQDMQRKLIEAHSAIIDTKMQMDNLGTVAEESGKKADGLATNLGKLNKKVSLEQVIGGIEKITDGMEKAAKFAVKVGKAVATEVLGAGHWADELATTAKNYGISTDELQRMQKTAEIIDTDADTILQARQKLARNNGSVEELLGFNVNGMSLEDAFWKTGKAIMGMTDAMAQEEAAQKIFGKGWRELVPLFDAGREEYERVNATWNTVSEEQLKSLTEMDDKYQKLKANLETLKMEALSSLAEPMGNLMQSLSDLINSDEGKATIENAMGTIKDTLNWISENQDTVITALKAMGVAFAGLKVTGSVLTFVKLASGLKGLFGGAEGAASAASSAAAGGGWVQKALAGIGKTVTTAGGASALTPLAVLGAGVLPAELVMNQTRQKWAEDYNRRTNAANGMDNNAWFISQAAEALGLNGQVDFGTTEMLLMGLANRQNQQKAELYNLLSGSTTAGSSTWNLLNSFWEGAELDPAQVNELLQDVTDAFANSAEKALVPVDVEVPDDAAAQISEQIGTVQIPGQIIMTPDGSHANGIWSVPWDGYFAMLHKGERVVPAREAASRNFSSNMYVEKMIMNNGQDAEGLAGRIAAENQRVMSGFGGV